MRLINENSRWALQVYRLVCVGRDVYRPRFSTIVGQAELLVFLKKADSSGSLYRTTSRVMKRLKTVDCQFISENGGWIPRPLPARPVPKRPFTGR
ncbi:MAG TPA: hypothetical protein VFQ61_28355 [Polyangiaceae bacterium]|nr:hypothetical protein [Polyangiaceae bacterium]